jgi:hypothetical protein
MSWVRRASSVAGSRSLTPIRGGERYVVGDAYDADLSADHAPGDLVEQPTDERTA